jgi:4'-phosphopantetheinyl transferase
VPLDLPPSVRPGVAATLSADGRARAARFRFDVHRDRYVAGRGVLRHLLARYLGVGADEVCFRYSAHGKTALHGSAAASGVCFNVSNADSTALIAFTLRRRLGVDPEAIRPMPDWAELANRFFSPAENEAVRALPPEAREAAFFTCWTRKEAYVKAVGGGLSIPLDSFAGSQQPGEPPRLLRAGDHPRGAAPWSLYGLSPRTGYVGALAVEGPSPAVLCLQFGWPAPTGKPVSVAARQDAEEGAALRSGSGAPHGAVSTWAC